MTTRRSLSKSKILAWLQCSKRLWLEVHRPNLLAYSEAAQGRFAEGHRIGDLARRLYDPQDKGELIDVAAEGYDAAYARTQALLQKPRPVFEAGFHLRKEGALAFADIMLPVRRKGQLAWRMVEVKSSASVKDYHRDDAAVQTFIAVTAGVPLAQVALAHIDSSWVYPGHEQYEGLLVEQDLTEQVLGRTREIETWLQQAHQVVARDRVPKVETGAHCFQPFECGFLAHCQKAAPEVAHPVQWLPRVPVNSALGKWIASERIASLSDVPDERLNEKQLRVKRATLSGRPYFDRAGARQELARYKLPAYFLDFETIHFAVPIWKGTRPYQQIPFQFSVQRLSRNGTVTETPFLDLSGSDPSRALAQALISACGASGPIFVYNASFERTRIQELAGRFKALSGPLLALNARMVDLRPIVEQHYYHPDQQGSWSIKQVLPALCPDLSYAGLKGVQDGGMAMSAYREAIASETTSLRRDEIEQQLLEYCGLDTWAMVRMWEALQH